MRVFAHVLLGLKNLCGTVTTQLITKRLDSEKALSLSELTTPFLLLGISERIKVENPPPQRFSPFFS
jgi:hypothetical protein